MHLTLRISVINYELQVLMGEGGQAVYPASGDQSALSMVQVSAVPQEGTILMSGKIPMTY